MTQSSPTPIFAEILGAFWGLSAAMHGRTTS